MQRKLEEFPFWCKDAGITKLGFDLVMAYISSNEDAYPEYPEYTIYRTLLYAVHFSLTLKHTENINRNIVIQ